MKPGHHYKIEEIVRILGWVSVEDVATATATSHGEQVSDVLLRRGLISDFQLDVAKQVQAALAERDRKKRMDRMTKTVSFSREAVATSYLRLVKGSGT